MFYISYFQVFYILFILKSSKDPFLPKGQGPKTNLGTPTVFERYLYFKSLFGHPWASLTMPTLNHMINL